MSERKLFVEASAGAPWCDIDIRKTLVSAGRTFALDVQLQGEHQRLVLMGPSGIGKTLVLLALAGLLRPDEGHIQLGDMRCFDSRTRLCVPPQRRRVGFLFQNYALLPHLTVLENVGFGLRRGGWWRLNRTQRDQAMHWLARFQIAHLAQQYPHTISGGQQQRVALARLAILSPQVLLLDEPFSALDPQLRHAMREEVMALLETLDIPLLMVSHDDEDRVALDAQVIRLGQVEGQTVRLAGDEGQPS